MATTDFDRLQPEEHTERESPVESDNDDRERQETEIMIYSYVQGCYIRETSIQNQITDNTIDKIGKIKQKICMEDPREHC